MSSLGAVPAFDGPLSSTSVSPHSMRQKLRPGEFLFKDGDVRHGVFRIEKGAIAVYQRLLARPNAKIEIAVLGDFVGLGCLERYSENARAISHCIVTKLPRNEFVALAEIDTRLKQLQAEAIEREFEDRKELLTTERHATPLECVAAFLVSLSRQNANEGRDPTVIDDSLSCGIVAGLLNLDMDTLARCLVQLQDMDLIGQGPEDRVSLKAIDMLERLADGSGESLGRRLRRSIPALRQAEINHGV